MHRTRCVLATTALCGALATLLLAGCGKKEDTIAQAAKQDKAAGVAAPGVAETNAIMGEAYVYGFPMVAACKAVVEFSIDRTSSQYKTAFNQIWNDSKPFTPKDTAIPTPNSDTPYSMLQADLRAEPLLLCVPAMDKKRHYSAMLADLYSFDSRTSRLARTRGPTGCRRRRATSS
ncbi:MAG TPA: DUF1254 domain-containing protein [Rubrivivax sp.]|nr:DUF1254 domain-containing protein [Rubrivivax sp.]HRY90063.1 DUF1254 domain-containing protein [Rubrivivax sp.]HRZ61392.1 DUF1254 domain-containing protein [Rubrivivax sp.]